MDIVFIQGLKIDCVIGIYDWEREIRQEITLDIEMSADIKAASETDHIDQTLDYKAVSKRLIDTKGVIRICKLKKDTQHNGQKEKDK
jgi:dihydroneopterin aldolase